MRSLSLYRFLSRFRWLNYRGKIMAMAFLGTHIPLLALIGFFVLRDAPDRGVALATLAMALAATLIGSAVSLWVLNELLRPITMTSAALRAYRAKHELPTLPTDFTDEAGLLMADTAATLTELDTALGEVAGSDRIASPLPGGKFVSETPDATASRPVTEWELRRAIASDELRLHLQPVIDLNLGRAIGAEALIRWQHPEHGLILPASFLPVAEASDLIDSIGLWVVRTACAQLGAWSESGEEGLGLAINLVARQFLDPNLSRIIADALQEAGVAADRLEVELTEAAAMRDRDVTAKIFGQLRDRGIRVAIDDFGAGYSNMHYLRTLPFDKLKIDREFVAGVDRSPNLHAIASALVGLARGLGAKVVAEGAEREEEVRVLHEEGCSLFQGFYFARPVAPDRFLDTISDIGLGARMMSIGADRLDQERRNRSVA